MSTSLSAEPEPGSPKRPLLTVPASQGQRSPASSGEPSTTSESTSSNASQALSEPPSPSFLFSRTATKRTTQNSLVVPPLPTTSLSTPTYSLMPSTKPPGDQSSGTPAPAGRPWRVELHRAVAKLIARCDLEDATFRPTIGELLIALRSDPKRFEKKQGQLAGTRAADIWYADGVAWRAVFMLDEEARVVKLLSLGPHDVAYGQAKRRLRSG